ncbi:MAG: hypothetical protein HY759_00490 [Nitrospirae bacterium]|nr:hypothetical protein [Nitrospirota bacterium]
MKFSPWGSGGNGDAGWTTASTVETCYFWNAADPAGKFATCTQHDGGAKSRGATNYGRPLNY